MTEYPSISVVVPTFNSEKTIELCLESIREQNYPQKKIEIIIADGGSTDKTLQAVKKFNTKLIKVDPKKQNVEFNKSMGIKKAKGELILMMDHDNILQSNNLLAKMVKPFLEIKELVGVETLRYHWSRNLTLLDRYFALFAVTDPLAYYLGKADRLSYIYDSYYKKYYPKDLGDYYLVKFNKNNIPTIGANGFMVKRKLLIDNADIRPGNYFPIDVNVDLIKKGFKTYAFIKDSITHIAGHGNIIYYLKRRMVFVKQFYLSDESSTQHKRRYSVYQKGDFLKLIFFILISITFIIPLIDSIRGFVKVRDVAWFIHPIICVGFVLMYGYVIIEHQFRILKKKLWF